MKFHTNIYGWEYVWRDFADDIGGEIVTEDTKKGPVVSALYAPLPGLTSHLTFCPVIKKSGKLRKGTTAVVHYAPSDNFAFAIHTEQWQDHFGKLMGMQDLLIGDEAFDSQFIVQGNDKVRVIDLFSDMDLRDAILMQPRLQLRILKDHRVFLPRWRVPAEHNVVICSQETVVENFDHLKSIYDVLAKILAQLVEMGATTQQGPKEEPTRGSGLHSPLLNR